MSPASQTNGFNQNIAALEMPEFMQNHKLSFLVGKFVGESQRKRKSRSPQSHCS